MNEMKLPLALTAPFLLLFVACSHDPREPQQVTADSNVVLYVSNQSFAKRTIDIEVKIDGEVVVNQDFAVGNQHTWIPFNLNLAPGKHVLTARSISGGATLVEEFEVSGEHWCVLSYWYTPDHQESDPRDPNFTFEQSNEPVYFI